MKKATTCGTLAGLLLLTCAGSIRAANQEPGEVIFHEDFKTKLADGWSFEREAREYWRVGPQGLEVRVQPGGMWGGGNNAKNVMVRSIPTPTDSPVEISMTVSNQPTARWEQGNLVWYYDGGNMVKLGQELVADRLTMVMGREENDRARTVAIVPLDSHTVELRLQVFQNRIRGQFRTAAWQDWRYVGECDLPVKGEPKASLHFYNGPANEDHWIRVSQFTVRRLPANTVDWPRMRVEEKTSPAVGNEQQAWDEIRLPGGFTLASSLKALAANPNPQCEQSIYRFRDGTYGWSWARRASIGKGPTVAGVGLGLGPVDHRASQGGFQPIKIANLKSLELQMDAVTRLDIDQGDHTFQVMLRLNPIRHVTILFDWYGKASEVQSLNDGYRDYGYLSTPESPDEIQYRIKSFQGAPPRVNLKAFLEDAAKRGLAPQSEITGIWLVNEAYNISRGATLVTKFDVLVDGKRYSSVPANPATKP